MNKLAPRHPLPRSPVVDRDSYLLDLCRGRDVLHLACAAWPATESLYQSGQLLHRKLQTACRRLAGADVSATGIGWLRAQGVDDLYVADLLDAGDVQRLFDRLGFRPELVIAGELLEHVDAPGELVRHVCQHMPPSCRLVATVPNAFALDGFLHVLLGREKVAPDHVCYFSATNLRELVERRGLRIAQFRWYRDSFPRRPLQRVVDAFTWPLLQLRPQLAPGMIAICERMQPATSEANESAQTETVVGL